MTAADSAEAQRYDPRAIQEKWQSRLGRAGPVPRQRRPSGPARAALRAGHVPLPVAATCTWVTPRRTRSATSSRATGASAGYDVLHPIGWDSFGLPAENAAIKRDAHPADVDLRQHRDPGRVLQAVRASRFDWSTPAAHLATRSTTAGPSGCSCSFCERGLAYRKDGPVNWCPNDQTVLANEQVVDGHCERCGAEVTKRELTQWYFKITDYADRLLDDMDAAGGRLARAGADRCSATGSAAPRAPTSTSQVEGRRRAGRRSSRPVPTPCTARRSSSSPPTPRWPPSWSRRQQREPASRPTCEQVRKADRHRAAGRPTGRRPASSWARYAINPVNGEPIPVWAADYVLADYGTGAIMAVPAHDQRDLDFATAFDLPVRVVVDTGAGRTRPTTGDRRPTGPTVSSVNSRPARRPGPRPRRSRTDHRRAGGSGTGRGRGELPAARLAAVPAAVLGLPDPDHPLPGLTARSRCPDDQLPVRAARPARRGPEAARASRRWPPPTDWVNVDLPEVRRPGQARHRHDGHLRRLVLVLPALLLAARRRRRRSTRRPAARVDAGRPVRRRRRARDPAPAVRAVLHQGAARHGAARVRRAVQPRC